MGYGMIGYVVPHTLYPMAIIVTQSSASLYEYASQKIYSGIPYGMYANPALLKWFTGEFSKKSKRNLIWGKAAYASNIRRTFL